MEDATTAPGRIVKVYWTDEEKEWVARTAWRLWKKEPGLSFTECVDRAQRQFPSDRRRNTKNTNNFADIHQRIKKLAAEEAEAEKGMDALRQENLRLKHELAQRPAPPPPLSREEVLRTVTEEEALTRYKQVILDHTPLAEFLARRPAEEVLGAVPLPKIIGYVAEHLAEALAGGYWGVMDFLTRPAAVPTLLPTSGVGKTTPANGTPPPQGKLPRVLAVGPLPGQGNLLRQRLEGKAEVNVLDKNRHGNDVPTGYDCYVFWARFCGHSMQDQVKKAAGKKFLLHHGGLEQMAGKVLNFLGHS